jgi:hypothetical protein
MNLMNYITNEIYESARLTLPDPNTSEKDQLAVVVETYDKTSKMNIHFVRVLFCESARLHHKEYKWILDKRFNQMA